MKILFDICHPAHVHFFKNAYQRLKDEGHQLLVTSRDKDCTYALLDAIKIPHKPLYTRNKSSFLHYGKELWLRNRQLYQQVMQFQPDLMAGIGGIFIAQVSSISGVPSLVFYDGDNALAQNLMTYPFATKVIVPNCYQGWTPGKRTVRYQGYHELSYMHPNYFTPNRHIALEAGLKEGKNYFIRLVSWQASHDKGHKGFDTTRLEQVVNTLAKLGNVMISSECKLPDSLKAFEYIGPVESCHHVMSYCDGFVGESPTMAIEAAIWGVPGLYVSTEQCGNILEIQKKYQLIKQVNLEQNDNLAQALQWLIDAKPKAKQSQSTLLTDCCDVTEMICQQLIEYHQQKKAV